MSEPLNLLSCGVFVRD